MHKDKEERGNTNEAFRDLPLYIKDIMLPDIIKIINTRNCKKKVHI